VAGVIVLDANVLIGFLDKADPHHEATLELLERRIIGGFASSVLTVAEALVHPTRVQRQDAALSSLLTIGLQIVPLDANDVLHLAEVRNTYRIRMPDAVALHIAITTGSELATFDGALARAANLAGVAVARLLEP
jgi:predicted nucleic acid-binding protein